MQRQVRELKLKDAYFLVSITNVNEKVTLRESIFKEILTFYEGTYIAEGITGIGKTTLAHILSEKESILFSVDDYFTSQKKVMLLNTTRITWLISNVKKIQKQQ